MRGWKKGMLERQKKKEMTGCYLILWMVFVFAFAVEGYLFVLYLLSLAERNCIGVVDAHKKGRTMYFYQLYTLSLHVEVGWDVLIFVLAWETYLGMVTVPTD